MNKPRLQCVFRVHQFPNLPTTNITLAGLSVRMIIDSGASVNIVDLDTYHELRVRKKVQIMPSNIRLFTYGSTTPLNIRGTIAVRTEYNGKQIPAKFVVVDNRGTASPHPISRPTPSCCQTRRTPTTGHHRDSQLGPHHGFRLWWLYRSQMARYVSVSTCAV